MELPTCVLVGTVRSATTYIYQVLAAHPEFFDSGAKALGFFDHNYEKGVEWYSSFYRGSSRYRAAGDFDPNYLADDRTPPRIAETLPEAKLLFCLREPVERVFDHYYWEQWTRGLVSGDEFDRGLTLIEFARKPVIFALGNYHRQLVPYFERFPRQRILVSFIEDLKRDSRAFLRTLYEFVGVDPSFEPPQMDQKVNPLRTPRFPRLTHFAYGVTKRLLRSGMPTINSKMRDDPLVNRVLFKPVKKDFALLERSIPELWPLYHADDRKLEALLGRKLPDNWSSPQSLQAARAGSSARR